MMIVELEVLQIGFIAPEKLRQNVGIPLDVSR
jgi:hypothetical protein